MASQITYERAAATVTVVAVVVAAAAAAANKFQAAKGMRLLA
jgi:hypothetical protein